MPTVCHGSTGDVAFLACDSKPSAHRRLIPRAPSVPTRVQITLERLHLNDCRVVLALVHSTSPPFVTTQNLDSWSSVEMMLESRPWLSQPAVIDVPVLVGVGSSWWFGFLQNPKHFLRGDVV